MAEAPEQGKRERWPLLKRYTKRMTGPARPVVGRDDKVAEVVAGLSRPEVANVMLLGEAGSGKSAIVEQAAKVDTGHCYREVDLGLMAEGLNDPSQLSARVKRLFNEAEEAATALAGRKAQGKGRAGSVVLFLDEIHQLAALSDTAMDAMKPLLARGAQRGVRVVAATTYEEYLDRLSKDLPFVERFARVDVPATDAATTKAILRGMCERHGASVPERLLEQIVEVTDRYVPSAAQPRKSINVLDFMIGWHRAHGDAYDSALLSDVVFKMHGVRVALLVDAGALRSELDAHVFAQRTATWAVERRLQVCMADLNDHTRPMGSFLFCGTTGVGKALADSEQVPVEDAGHGVPGWLQVSRVVPGRDRVLGDDGRFHAVTGSFPQGKVGCAHVRLSNGAWHVCSWDHVFTVRVDGGALQDLTVRDVASAVAEGRGVSIDRAAPVAGRLSWGETAEEACERARADGASLAEGDEGAVARAAAWALAPEGVRLAFLGGLFDAAGSLPGEGEPLEWRPALSGLGPEALRAAAPALLAQGMEWDELPEGGGAVGARFRCSLATAARLFGPDADGASYDAAVLLRSRLCQGMADPGPAPVHVLEVVDAGERWATCIEVDAPGSLFLTSSFCPTHNTEMCKQLARLLFDDPRALVRFDMSEYALDSSQDRFRDELTSRVWQRPNSVVLLDEVEKADPAITRILLQVLDDGRLSDRHGRETSFQNSYIVLTTNAAADSYKGIHAYAGDDEERSAKAYERIMGLLMGALTAPNEQGEVTFPPELLGRIDKVVPFQTLQPSTRRRICEARLEAMAGRVRDLYGVEVRWDDRVVRYACEEKAIPGPDAGGAREVVRTVDDEAASAVASRINAGERPRALRIKVEGTMRCENKRTLVGDAYLACVPE